MSNWDRNVAAMHRKNAKGQMFFELFSQNEVVHACLFYLVFCVCCVQLRKTCVARPSYFLLQKWHQSAVRQRGHVGGSHPSAMSGRECVRPRGTVPAGNSIVVDIWHKQLALLPSLLLRVCPVQTVLEGRRKSLATKTMKTNFDVG